MRTLSFRLTGRATRAAALVLLGATFLATGCSSKKDAGTSGGSASSSAGVLKIGIIPFENPDKIKETYQLFGEYMGKKCGGKTGDIFVTPEYAGVLQALKSDQIDCAYLNPLSYALAVQEFKGSPEELIPISMPVFHGKPTYQGIIYARTDSGINSMKDFKGKSFAFGDRTSTSGYLYPAGLMKEAGLDPQKDVKAANITGPGGVIAVLNKQIDGGATFEGGIELALTNPAQAKQIKVVTKTDPIPNGMFVVRGNLDPATIAQIKKAFIDINTEADGKAAVKEMQYDKWIPADDAVFNSVRKKRRFSASIWRLWMPIRKNRKN